MSAYDFVGSGQNFTIFFVQRRKNRSRYRRLKLVASFIDFGDICA